MTTSSPTTNNNNNNRTSRSTTTTTPIIRMRRRRRRLLVWTFCCVSVISVFVYDVYNVYYVYIGQLESFYKQLTTGIFEQKATTSTASSDDPTSSDGCRGVLITSQGGVGSSAFIHEFDLLFQKKGTTKNINNFFLNHPADKDGFKHIPATAWKHHNATSLIGTVTTSTNDVYKNGTEFCFNRVLVIVGDPIHTIESTYRRFGVAHLRKLQKWAPGLDQYPIPIKGNRKKNRPTLTLKRIYNDMLKSNRDKTGISHYIHSWYNASCYYHNNQDQDQDQEDPSMQIIHHHHHDESWPKIHIVTAKLLYNNAMDYARYIIGVGGVDDDDDNENENDLMLLPFSNLTFDTSKQRKTTLLTETTENNNVITNNNNVITTEKSVIGDKEVIITTTTKMDILRRQVITNIFMDDYEILKRIEEG